MTLTHEFKMDRGKYNPIETLFFNEAERDGKTSSHEDYIEWFIDNIDGVSDAIITGTPFSFHARYLEFESEEYYIAFLLKYT